MSEVTKVLSLSLLQWKWALPSAQSPHVFLIVYIIWSCRKWYFCKKFIWCTFQSRSPWEDNHKAFRKTGQALNTDHLLTVQILTDTGRFCSHCWKLLNDFTRSGSLGQVPINSMAQTNAPYLICENLNQMKYFAIDLWQEHKNGQAFICL